MMNVWEEAYFRHKESQIVSKKPQADNRLFSQLMQQHLPDSHHHQTASVSAKSFEEVYYQINRGQCASSEPINSQGNSQRPFDIHANPYPEKLLKMRRQLSDIWANLTVATQQKVETLLVAGAIRKEGSTFFSYFLSLFLSKEYKMKILYMDTNLNHAGIPNIQNLPGLDSLVSGKKELSSLIVRSQYPGLFLLPSGAGENAANAGANPPSRELIKTLIGYCRENFDLTIIDGQPLTLSPIMIEFARVTDMTALVCRYGYSRREVSRRAVEKLRKFGVTSIGVILNDCQLPIPKKIYRLMG